jgi:hypothetical protein
MEDLKLGKTPARKAVKFKLRDFIDLSQLPKPPNNFGHENLIERKSWGMLGNDVAGDCVFAGAAHETMMWNLCGGKVAKFDDASCLKNYSAVTGYNPKIPNTDQGTDMKTAAEYRRTTGIIDANGIIHKVEAYLDIDPGNLLEHYVAMYLFDAVGIGIRFPASAMDQFRKGQVWKVVRGGSPNEGGHYIPLVAKRTFLQSVSWGQTQPMTNLFFSTYNDESITYVSKEMLINNKSPEGFDSDGLIKALNQLK